MIFQFRNCCKKQVHLIQSITQQRIRGHTVLVVPVQLGTITCNSQHMETKVPMNGTMEVNSRIACKAISYPIITVRQATLILGGRPELNGGEEVAIAGLKLLDRGKEVFVGNRKLVDKPGEAFDGGSGLSNSNFIILDWYTVSGCEATHIAPSEGGEHGNESKTESRVAVPSTI